MLLRLGFLVVFLGLTMVGRDASAGDPVLPSAVTLVHNLSYREGSKESIDTWRLDLAMPTARGSKPRPGIIVIHGGGWVEGDRSSFTSRDSGVPGNIVDFAAQGFVAVAINYRLSGEASFPAALEDCQCAVRWLRAHAATYDLDAQHIGVFGNSAGGHLALLLGLLGRDTAAEKDVPYSGVSSRVQAVVSDSGLIDLLYQYEHDRARRIITQFLGGPPEGERIVAYRRASPRWQITKDAPPMLLIYGAADEQVPVETADDFVSALHHAGLRDVTYHRLAYVDHCPFSLIRIPNLQPIVNEFFMRTLMHPETAQQIKRREN
jgi:acetyl esterase/lipase